MKPSRGWKITLVLIGALVIVHLLDEWRYRYVLPCAGLTRAEIEARARRRLAEMSAITTEAWGTQVYSPSWRVVQYFDWYTKISPAWENYATILFQAPSGFLVEFDLVPQCRLYVYFPEALSPGRI